MLVFDSISTVRTIPNIDEIWFDRKNANNGQYNVVSRGSVIRLKFVNAMRLLLVMTVLTISKQGMKETW